MSEERIKEVFSDEEFVKGLMEFETPGEVCAALKEKGVEMTEDDVIQVKELLMRKSSGELSDEELEDVAGGVIGAVAWVAIIAAAVVTGTGMGLTEVFTRGRW